ncbi:hypothetical protein [Jannaschia aquimarina]|nr:hypothetical protein [Jannaschia aquimarina]
MADGRMARRLGWPVRGRIARGIEPRAIRASGGSISTEKKLERA